MYVKIMSGEDIPDRDSRKNFRLIGGVEDVIFQRKSGGELLVEASLFDGATISTEAEGNVYLLDETGNVISVKAHIPYRSEPVGQPMTPLEQIRYALHKSVEAGEEPGAVGDTTGVSLAPADVDAEIRDARFEPHYGPACAVSGYIYGDQKGRFDDGTFIHTSKVRGSVQRVDGSFIVTTLNSRYRVLPANWTIK